MADGKDKPGLKSVRADKPLRSRGFLSQPGGGRAPEAVASHPGAAPNLSRGSRQITPSTGKAPTPLSDKPKIKRYTPEGS
ncbi:hypothetical protein E1180_08610 [Roseibium denhamense]|uniref:Uncharacterized protein n=1 Tax=Roseibium denhamense TaxID=76305 RepID=A0ABY1PJ56_9HYPH|nr:hypothetical protein [Roseibium denhamense]MTI05577.1 hypothetical protein [Roseibium denhamense]SMP34655.1 hypothetical protein SAMN06265374_3902 [Roseibium denhamense]